MASIGLLLVNIFLIWFTIGKKRPEERRAGPKNIIIKKLHFDENQVKDYEILIKAHRSNIESSNSQMKILKNHLFATLKGQNQHIDRDSLINEIGKLQIKLENIHYDHFIEIKKLCKPNQLSDYDLLCDELGKLFVDQMPRNGGR